MVTNHIRYSTVLSNLRRRRVTNCVDSSSFVLSFATSLAWGTIGLRFTLSMSTPCSSSLTTLMTHFFIVLLVLFVEQSTNQTKL